MGLGMVNRVWEEGDQVKEEGGGGGGQNVDACERWDTIKQNSFRRKEYIYLLPNHTLPPVCPKYPQRKRRPRPGKLSPPAVVSTSAGIFFRSRFKVQPSRSAGRKSERASVRERERERTCATRRNTAQCSEDLLPPLRASECRPSDIAGTVSQPFCLL